MATNLKKFISRSPRYVLRPSDDHFLRYAHKDNKTHTYTTNFINISMTGLAFATDRDSAPRVGDVIKIEFPTVGGKHIAWWAQVKRIEEFDPQSAWLHRSDFKGQDKILVGVRFHELPLEYMQEIEASIKNKFNQVQANYKKERMEMTMLYIASNFWKLCILAFTLFATIAIFYYLTRPTTDYDPDRGTPWGKRFKINRIFDK